MNFLDIITPALEYVAVVLAVIGVALLVERIQKKRARTDPSLAKTLEVPILEAGEYDDTPKMNRPPIRWHGTLRYIVQRSPRYRRIPVPIRFAVRA